MGATATSEPSRAGETDWRLLARFARAVRTRYRGARIYLFGSHARGTAATGSDYDVVVISQGFARQRLMARDVDLYGLWREAGGEGSAWTYTA
ncbi:MAG: nucleotidyltransferase domain-containing protein [Chloroflexota bacterium]